MFIVRSWHVDHPLVFVLILTYHHGVSRLPYQVRYIDLILPFVPCVFLVCHDVTCHVASFVIKSKSTLHLTLSFINDLRMSQYILSQPGQSNPYYRLTENNRSIGIVLNVLKAGICFVISHYTITCYPSCWSSVV